MRRRTSWTLFLSSLALASMLACADDDPPPSPAASAEAGVPDVRLDGAQPQGPDDAGKCTDLVVEGPVVLVDLGGVGDAGDADAAPLGGTLGDGTYVLQRIIDDGDPPSAASSRETIRLSGGAFEQAAEERGGSRAYTFAGTYTTSGTTLELAISCSTGLEHPPRIVSIPYGVTGERVVLYGSFLGHDIRSVYERKR